MAAAIVLAVGAGCRSAPDDASVALTTTAPESTAPDAPSPRADRAAATTGAAPCAAAGRDPRVGFSPGHEIISDDDAAVTRDLDGMAATGACWIRIDIDWSRIQPEPGRFDWTETDRAVAGARARGMEVLGLLAYTPAWARPEGASDKHPPTDVATFEAFATQAALRYRSHGVHTWEIWNEPNLGAFWEPAPDPAAYARLLAAAAEAIRQVDDRAVILSGGLSPAPDSTDGSNIAPVSFLDAVYDAGAADSFDAVAMHPYSFPLNPVEAVPLNHFVTVTPELRDVMAEHGDEDKLIWATEYGAPTGTSDQSVDAGEQAEFLADALEQWEEWPWTGPLLVYSWRDRGTDSADREDNFGLVDHESRPKPALDVLLSAIEDPG